MVAQDYSKIQIPFFDPLTGVTDHDEEHRVATISTPLTAPTHFYYYLNIRLIILGYLVNLWSREFCSDLGYLTRKVSDQTGIGSTDCTDLGVREVYLQLFLEEGAPKTSYGPLLYGHFGYVWFSNAAGFDYPLIHLRHKNSAIPAPANDCTLVSWALADGVTADIWLCSTLELEGVGVWQEKTSTLKLMNPMTPTDLDFLDL